jgi:hypothetical protein
LKQKGFNNLPQKKKPKKKKAVGLDRRGKKARVERSGTLYYPCFFIAGRHVGAWHNFASFFVGWFYTGMLVLWAGQRAAIWRSPEYIMYII